MFFFFFFQAEDGIRDATVTGVQTCALPIYARAENGNVVQVAALKNVGASLRGRPAWRDRGRPRSDAPTAKPHWTLALGFGATTAQALKNARASLAKGFARVRREY